jgi:hypothetical protein
MLFMIAKVRSLDQDFSDSKQKLVQPLHPVLAISCFEAITLLS